VPTRIQSELLLQDTEMIFIFSGSGGTLSDSLVQRKKKLSNPIRWKNARACNLKGLPISAEFDGSGWFDGIVEDGE
jgi:hypothetical protein